jgi:ABC-type nitrate/sulfonate/bicarbonate transport system substrate-binding protein
VRLGRLTLAAFFCCTLSSCDRKPGKAELDVVRIADRGFLTSAPVYVADGEGYFADEGIRLEYSEPPRSSNQVIPLLERGDIDVMTASVTSAFYSAVSQGARSRIVADRGHIEGDGCDYDGVMARRGLFDSIPPTAETLRGKRFSLGSAGAFAYMMDQYLETMNLTTKDLNVVRLGETLEVQALEAGSIDGLHVAEPYLSKLVAQGHKLIGPSRIYSKGLQYAVVIYGPSLTVKKREVGHRFMKAYLRGVAKFREGATPRNIAIISKRTGIDSASLARICMPTVNADGSIDQQSLLGFQKWVVKQGSLPGVVGLDGGTDMTFAVRAAQELGIKRAAR